MTAANPHFAAPPGGMHLIPAPKSGMAFLASSTFTTSQDPTVTAPSLKSTFKRDYPPWPLTSKQAASVPPEPAHVLHKDDRHFNAKVSETTKAFQFRAGDSLVRPDMTDVSVKLRSTNYKVHRDLSKFDSFQTSHMAEFYEKEFQGVPKSMPKENPMESFIPQGDPALTAEVMSDYRRRFKGHDALSTKPDRAACKHLVGPPTIKGDGRMIHFDTTHNDQYQGVSLPRIAAFPPPTVSNIPQGDKAKQATFQTVHQASFQGHDVRSLAGPEDVAGKLGRTNFRLTDGHGTYDTYQSTAKDSYQAVASTPFRSVPANHRNHSDLPGGDLDPRRMAESMAITTNRHFHDRKAMYGPADIVSGANKLTASQVPFGDPCLNENYYDTTTSSVFKATGDPHQPRKPYMSTQSHIPMNYYENLQNVPTTWSDFQNPDQGKLILNERALDKLKKASIHAPLGGERYFSTEHLDQFVHKTSERVPIDGGRLHRSTVPLGTLKINHA